MHALRKALGVLMALAIAAIAAPAIAQPSKIYSLAFSAGALTAGSNPDLRVRIKNESPSGNSSINSIEIVLPSGYTVGGTVAFDPAFPGNVDTSTAGRVRITNMAPVKRGESVFLRLPVNVAATSTCSANGWDASVAWTGSSLAGETFAKVAPTSLGGYSATTSVLTGLSLSFTTIPVSVVNGAPFSVAVRQSTSCAGVTPPTVTITLSGSVAGAPSPSFVAGTPTAAGDTTTFAGNRFTSLGVATLTASAPGYTPVSRSFNVFASGGLDCSTAANPTPTDPPSAFQFDGSPGVNDIAITSYAKGVRGPNKASPCQLVNYTFLNNVLGPSGVTDGNGNTLPSNAVSFIWDTIAQPDAAYRYTVTWQAEYVGANGLPQRTTRYCQGVGVDCTLAANQIALQACVGTDVAVTSLPAGQPACIVGEVWTTVVPSSECGPNPNAPNAAPACVRTSTTIIDAKDPVMIRG